MTLRVEAVDVERILPVRRDVLRPGLPLAAARFDGDDAAGALHLAVLDGQATVLACATLLPVPLPEGSAWAGTARPAWQLRGMAVDGRAQRSGLGGRLLVEVARRVGGGGVWCNARVTAEAFYRRNGWERVEDVFDVPGVGPHVRMVWWPG